MPPTKSIKNLPKYQTVLDTLRAEIAGGVYPPGKRLPSEAELEKRFGTSRITVGRAMQELRQQNLIERRAGSGTFARAVKPGGLLFGLLIPNLGQSEIFEPICQGMTDSPQAGRHSLIWGSMGGGRETAASPAQTWELCQQYIEQKVAGVFFAPLESQPADLAVNARVTGALRAARIPVVLLDRDFLPYPQRSPHDLVGIDNRRAGYLVTNHLLELGCQRVAFVTHPNAASTIGARIAGYQEALIARKLPLVEGAVRELDTADSKTIDAFIRSAKPQAIVCSNDRTAGTLMHTLLDLGLRIPQDLRIAGIDDAGYASLLPVPLTTVRQPCREIGMAAMAAMVERLGRPAMPARDILLACQLVVRASSAS